MNPSRRGFLGFLAVAPMIVKASSLMPIRAVLDLAIDDFDTNLLRVKATERFAFGYFDLRAMRGILMTGLDGLQIDYKAESSWAEMFTHV